MTRRWFLVGATTGLVALATIWLCVPPAWTSATWRHAMLLEQQRDFNGSLAAWQKYLEGHPASGAAQLNAAIVARRGDNLPMASEHLRLATDRGADPKTVARERLLQAVQAGEIDATRAGLELATIQNDDQGTALILEALIRGALRHRRVAAAMAVLDRYETVPLASADRAQALIWRGECWRMAGEPRRAAEVFDQALKLEPANDAARLRLAESLTQDDPARARALIADVLERKEDPVGRLILARACRNLGDLEQAEVVLTQLGRDRPADGMVQMERGALALDRGEFDGAVRWLERLPDAIKKSPEALALRLRLARAMGNTALATTLAGELAALESEQNQARKNLGGLP